MSDNLRATPLEMHERGSKTPLPAIPADKLVAVTEAIESAVQGHWSSLQAATEVFRILGYDAPTGAI